MTPNRGFSSAVMGFAEFESLVKQFMINNGAPVVKYFDNGLVEIRSDKMQLITSAASFNKKMSELIKTKIK